MTTPQTITHLTTAELEAGLDQIRQAPTDAGTLELIVRRPRSEERDLLTQGELNREEGLAGDNWQHRATANLEAQLTIMNARAAQLVAQSKERWPLAGDQLYVDLDLSDANLPPGSRLAIGEAVVEVSALPHNGCKKFVQRFGLDAMNFVNSPEGKALHLRGINAKIIQPGAIRVGDVVRKL